MSIAGLLVLLLVFGFIAYMLMTAPIPIQPWFKSAIVGILVIAMIIYLLNAFGVDTGIPLRLK